ncbi:MAG TPA: hypothetical protein VHI93_05870, partial [Candidatus Thermoplasmatota archaeon]|nr:hypothetical protein [Candidatus Thermoplasmatota archaeon]
GLATHKRNAHKAPKLKTGLFMRLGVPPLVAIIIQIELIDLAFAIDQVIVAVAFTDKVALIVVASVIGILFLRLAAAAIARIMDWLPLLEHMAYVAVSYVGVKLVLLYPFPFLNDGHGVHVPTPVSISITLALFVLPILVKLVFKVPRSMPEGTHEAAVEPVQPPAPAKMEGLEPPTPSVPPERPGR